MVVEQALPPHTPHPHPLQKKLVAVFHFRAESRNCRSLDVIWRRLACRDITGVSAIWLLDLSEFQDATSVSVPFLVILLRPVGLGDAKLFVDRNRLPLLDAIDELHVGIVVRATRVAARIRLE